MVLIWLGLIIIFLKIFFEKARGNFRGFLVFYKGVGKKYYGCYFLPF